MSHSKEDVEFASALRKYLDHLCPKDQRGPAADLDKTPLRVASALKEMTRGNRGEMDFNFTTFPTVESSLISFFGMPFNSLCSHHMLPFVGTASVGYIPNWCIAGASKIPRALARFSARLTNQEALTNDLAAFLQENLQPAFLIVILSAEHQCVRCRGVRVSGMRMVTTSIIPSPDESKEYRHAIDEFYRQEGLAR